MNTKIYVIFEKLPHSIGMGEGILKYQKGVHMEVKGYLGYSTKKKKNNTK